MICGDLRMTDNEYAICIYLQVYRVKNDDGDAYCRGILDAIRTLDNREQIALECYYRYGKTFAQTGKEIGGIGEQGAKNVVSKVLRKLRHQSRARNMSVAAIMEHRDKLLEEAEFAKTELCDQVVRLAQGEPIDYKIQAILNARKKSISEICFSSRVSNHLICAGITTVESLLALDTLNELEKRRNFGQKSRDEIINKMREQGHGEWADRMNVV